MDYNPFLKKFPFFVISVQDDTILILILMRDIKFQLFIFLLRQSLILLEM